MMNNIELLRQTATKGLVDNIDHTRRLLDLKGIRNWERIKLDLIDASFRWYITAENLNKFKHFAILRTVGRVGNYIGDIPDFAIDRAELALSLGIKEITIHSMQSLPISRVNTDPIMVGWIRIPDMASDGAFTYGFFCDREGVVISAWNMEKEIDLL